MTAYTPPVADMTFLLQEVFDLDNTLSNLPGLEDVSTELAVSILEEAGKFCVNVLEPLNRPDDEEGCRLKDGMVMAPQSFPAAYREFVAAGWPGLSGAVGFGGAGLATCAAGPAG